MSAFGWMNLIANAKVLVNKYKHLQDECLYKYVNQLSNIYFTSLQFLCKCIVTSCQVYCSRQQQLHLKGNPKHLCLCAGSIFQRAAFEEFNLIALFIRRDPVSKGNWRQPAIAICCQQSLGFLENLIQISFSAGWDYVSARKPIFCGLFVSRWPWASLFNFVSKGK